MATIAQRELFTWKEIENLGDLQRLRLVQEYLPDDGLMRRQSGMTRRLRIEYPAALYHVTTLRASLMHG